MDRILIATGGGGHFAPALCVIETLPKNIKILVVGRKYSLEGDKALSLEYLTTESMHIPFAAITTGRLQRKLTSLTFISLLKFPIGIWQSYKLIRSFKPKVIVSFGGYVSLPVIFIGAMLRVPIVIHEQTLGAGLANRLASVFAKKICISWESSRSFFPKSKTVLTGNPVKKLKIKSSNLKINEKLPTLFVTGGSSGSHFINQVIEASLSSLLEKFNLIHQTGDAQKFKDFERFSKLKDSMPEQLQTRYSLTKFVKPDEFGSVISKADLVICRSGMNTVSEVIYFGKPALMIPLPFSQGGEQLQNAEFLKKLGLGEILEQKDVTKEKFEKLVDFMIGQKEAYKAKSKSSKKLITHNATERVIEVIKESLKA